MLFCPVMKPLEAIYIENALTFSKHSGYADSLTFTGPYDSVFEQQGQSILAIDALVYQSWPTQFEEVFIERELNKVFAGLRPPQPEKSVSNQDNIINGRPLVLPRLFSTGNWGCGAFGGLIDVKFLIQLAASSHAGIDKMIYHKYTDKRVTEAQLEAVYNLLIARNVTTGQLVQLLFQYKETKGSIDVFGYLSQKLLEKDASDQFNKLNGFGSFERMIK